VLTPLDVTQHLLSRGLVSNDEINGHFRIVSRSRNNRNFEVVVSGRPGYFLKESRNGSHWSATEADLYRAINGNARVRHYVPKFHDYDAGRCVVVLELIKGARDVSESFAGRELAAARIATELGVAVAAIHEFVAPRDLCNADVPWVLTLAAPDIRFLEDTSGANLELLRIVQSSRALSRTLDGLAAAWRPLSLIHGDLRFANCLVAPRARKWSLKIVDWEMGGIGESAWDAGSVFAAFLSAWIGSMSARRGARLSHLCRSARLPLARLQPAMQQFAAAYVSVRRLRGRARDRFLVHAIRFTAARLIQTAFEQMRYSTSLTANAILSLQLSANIAARPADALSALCGIEMRQ
jgi:aminoglycoside phosphotransferase (APT) family kinase protein